MVRSSKTTTAAATAAPSNEVSKQAQNANGERVGKRRKRSNTTSFSSYIHRLLKQSAPETGISTKAMTVMDTFCRDMFERISEEASRIARFNGKQTISAKTIQSACQLVLPGEIARHAISAGTKAVTAYVASSE